MGLAFCQQMTASFSGRYTGAGSSSGSENLHSGAATSESHCDWMLVTPAQLRDVYHSPEGSSTESPQSLGTSNGSCVR